MTPDDAENSAGVSGLFGGGAVVIGDYLRTRLWLRARLFRSSGNGARTYQDEAVLWGDALGGRGLFETQRLTLKDVDLLEWIPRSPGLYYKKGAEEARAEATTHILSHEERGVVLDPIGKAGMVWGGIGCLRLGMRHVDGQPTKFLCATSSGRAHRGFVVAVGSDDFARIAEDVSQGGSVRCTVKGQLRVATPDSGLHNVFRTGVPRLYLAADELDPQPKPRDQAPLDVTPAITFRPGDPGREDGLLPSRPYYAYGHFDPARQGSLEVCVEWLERAYVGVQFEGRILTDFDEQVGHFESVTCPLSDLMDLSVPARSFDAPLLEGFGNKAMFFVQTLEMNTVSNVTITGDGNVVGNDNRVVTTIHKDLNEGELKAVGEALALLRGEIVSLDDVPDKIRNRSLRAIEDAEDELAAGDPDPHAVEASLHRVRDTLVAAGETYDATVGWAQRLRGVAIALGHIIPGAAAWLAL